MSDTVEFTRDSPLPIKLHDNGDGTYSLVLYEANSAAAASPSSVGSSATVVTLLAANASRRGALFFNESTAVLYLKFGTAATTSSYSVQVAAGGYYEMPVPTYQGAVTGIWASANGNVRITELS